MGSADAWVQDWWTSVLPMANEPSTNVLGPACAIRVGSTTVPGHVRLLGCCAWVQACCAISPVWLIAVVVCRLCS